ncbi:mevalonate kinase [Pendulispora albinea]|uniref:mevalonate kinase n=1 Tax=Pendulispora albinea TaxID=2741071 RepID=A0ABZ2MAE6_9BACT
MSSFRGFGKVILLGEHAVVYGYPALAAALERGVEVSATRGDGMLLLSGLGAPEVRKRLPALLPPEFRAGEDALISAYQAILGSLGIDPRVLRHDFAVRSELPLGSGLGSSAALAVALARAISGALGLGASEPAIAAAAHAAESVFHGNPSGIDQAIAQHGGFGVYRRATGLVPLLADSIPLCVGLTGRCHETRTLVQRVAELHRDEPVMTSRVLEGIGVLVQEGASAVLRGDLVALGHAMSRNQEELAVLGVSCREIDTMCTLARGAGALGAKLTGGGGGGSVIALAPDDPEKVRAAWRSAGFESFVTTVGSGAEPLAAAGAA